MQQKLHKAKAARTIEDTSPPPGNALLADRSFNDRDLPSHPRQNNQEDSVILPDKLKSPLIGAKVDISLGSVTQQKALPEKLQKMRERVKRERSCNQYYRDPSREDSLYGRKRASQELGKVRKSAKSTIFLSKTNFREDFDAQQSLPMTAKRLDVSSERRKAGRLGFSILKGGKENSPDVRRSMNVTQVGDEPNRFKRTQKSLMALNNFQAKYDRLE